MHEEEYRIYSEPKPPRRLLWREGTVFRAITFGVLVFSIVWIIATAITPDIRPSRLTRTIFLILLIFYSGEYINWKRPKLPKRKPRQLPWRKR